MNNKTLLFIGGAALAYWWWQKNKTPSAPAATPAALSAPLPSGAGALLQTLSTAPFD